MSMLNPDGRKSAYELCRRRDGHRCRRCRRGIKVIKKLIVDHIDNNPHRNPKDGTNWQLLCQSCNSKKNPRGPSKRGLDARHKILSLERERERESVREPESEKVLIRTAEMKRNMDCEPKFREWLECQLEDLETMDVTDLVNGAAEYVGCSQQTIRRYLDKMCSFTGGYSYYMGDDGNRRVRRKAPKVIRPILVAKTEGVAS